MGLGKITSPRMGLESTIALEEIKALIKDKVVTFFSLHIYNSHGSHNSEHFQYATLTFPWSLITLLSLCAWTAVQLIVIIKQSFLPSPTWKPSPLHFIKFQLFLGHNYYPIFSLKFILLQWMISYTTYQLYSILHLYVTYYPMWLVNFT